MSKRATTFMAAAIAGLWLAGVAWASEQDSMLTRIVTIFSGGSQATSTEKLVAGEQTTDPEHEALVAKVRDAVSQALADARDGQK